MPVWRESLQGRIREVSPQWDRTKSGLSSVIDSLSAVSFGRVECHRQLFRPVCIFKASALHAQVAIRFKREHPKNRVHG